MSAQVKVNALIRAAMPAASCYVPTHRMGAWVRGWRATARRVRLATFKRKLEAHLDGLRLSVDVEEKYREPGARHGRDRAEIEWT